MLAIVFLIWNISLSFILSSKLSPLNQLWAVALSCLTRGTLYYRLVRCAATDSAKEQPRPIATLHVTPSWRAWCGERGLQRPSDPQDLPGDLHPSGREDESFPSRDERPCAAVQSRRRRGLQWQVRAGCRSYPVPG